MKKILVSLVILLAGFVSVSAQNASAHFGLLGGVTTNSFITVDELRYKPLAGWTAGGAVLVKLPAYFSIQPTLMYECVNVQVAEPVGKVEFYNARQHMLSAPFPIQWGLDLGVIRPYVQVVPAVSFNLGSQNRGVPESSWSDVKAFLSQGEFSLGVGGGLEIWKIQISVRYSWCLGDWSSMTRENPFFDIKSRRKGLQATVGFFF